MNPSKWFTALSFSMLLALAIGCSGGNALAPSEQMGQLSAIGLSDTDGIFSEIGVLGAFDLTINPNGKIVELNPKRLNTIGESYIVSGMAFFTAAPCSDCFKLTGFDFSGGNVSLLFNIEHPFQRGNPANPPTATNRLDLDVFDLAILVNPIGSVPVNFPVLGVDVYDGVIAEPDGYTKELASVTGGNIALPYVLVVDDCDKPAPHTFNKFAMGASADCKISFILSEGSTLTFDMFLTMGYGSSAKRPTRLTPKYYNPEFNRKAAWKVVVIPPSPILDTPLVAQSGEIYIWDWQQGATVYSDPLNFKDAPTDNIYESSDVGAIDVEIAGMTHVSVDPLIPTGGTGLPDDPLVYQFMVHNDTLQPAGIYPGVVKITDTRAPKLPAAGRDFLIHTEDGINLLQHPISEFATYQTFSVEVVHEGIAFGQMDCELEGVKRGDSSYGSVTLGYYGPADPQFLNLSVNGNWVIRNIPVLPYAGIDVPQAVTIGFDLGVPPGTNVGEVLVGWSLDILPSMVPPPPMTPYAVADGTVRMSSGKLEGWITYIPPPPYLSGAAIVDYAMVADTVFNQDCGKNECVPAAVSNSLHWLQVTSGSPPSDKDTSINKMKTATGWTATGCPANWDDGKGTYMNNNGYGVTTTGIPDNRPVSNAATAADCDAAMQALKDGKDVELDGANHVARITGMTKNANGTYSITVIHDTNQGNAGGQKSETFIYDPSQPNPVAQGGWGFNGKKINGFVAEK